MTRSLSRLAVALTACAGLAAASAHALPVKRLITMQERGDEVTVVDVRSPDAFQRGHITGAINIPAAVVADKPLPPLGFVVVYGAPDAPGGVRRAVDALNDKPGIRAEELEGGLIRWQAANGADTSPVGMKSEGFRYINNQQLSDIVSGGNEMIIDMRSNRSQPIWTDRLEGARIIKIPPGRVAKRLARMKPSLQNRGRFVVLIGDDQAQLHDVAQKAFECGITDFGILAGGSEALEDEMTEKADG